MGHLGRLKDEYRQLVERLEAGQVSFPEPAGESAWNGWREVLEILYTPDEAALASQMPTRPASLDAIARRTGLAPAELEPRLEKMCEKGVVMDLLDRRNGKVRYLLSPPVVGFVEFSLMRAHDSLPKKRLAEALDAYMQGDEAFAREAFGGETVIGRALAHEGAIDDELPDVLAWERATSVIEEATARAVSLCYCRHKAEHLGESCDAPVEICLSLNGGAEHVIRRGFGRSVSQTEALELLAQAREAGLVQIADNVQQRPIYLCNCCGCCCEQLRAVTHYGIAAVNPSGFQPAVDREKCKGCLRCARACPVTAIGMRAVREARQRKNELEPEIDLDRCIGCGLCVDACRNRAMKLERRAERRYVPEHTLERVVRMALERGHLADLVFDSGESRGSRFMNRLTRAIAALPPVEAALANEQLKSRFVRGLMGRMHGGARV